MLCLFSCIIPPPSLKIISPEVRYVCAERSAVLLHDELGKKKFYVEMFLLGQRIKKNNFDVTIKIPPARRGVIFKNEHPLPIYIGSHYILPWALVILWAMCSPVSHTHPTKLMFTVGALHVVTSSILLYTDITLRTVLEYTDIIFIQIY